MNFFKKNELFRKINSEEIIMSPCDTSSDPKFANKRAAPNSARQVTMTEQNLHDQGE